MDCQTVEAERDLIIDDVQCLVMDDREKYSRHWRHVWYPHCLDAGPAALDDAGKARQPDVDGQAQRRRALMAISARSGRGRGRPRQATPAR